MTDASTLTPLGTAFDRLADSSPDAPAVIFRDRTYTRSELARRSNQLARHLASLGVDEGATVTIGLPNGVPFYEATLAVWKLGAVSQPISSRLPAGELGALVPTMMSRILRLPDDERLGRDMSTLHTAYHLAAPCPPHVKQAWIDWLGADVIAELYAGTEAQAATMISGTEWLEHPGSVGRVVLGEMKVTDPDGESLPPHQIGEIWMRASVDRPTYHYVGATARARHGWESLGDMGWFDSDGYLYLADRQTDMILVGGANVYPAEVEAALEEHPSVLSSCVIGLPDDDYGNVVHAIVETRGDLSDDELRDHLASRLVRYKIPRTFERSGEPLRDDAGKVRRSAWRAARMPS